uniref:Uncharacterized protein n=1 Tax=Oryza glaberrima TaxID=4538 RepID=I1QDU6_ORYGL
QRTQPKETNNFPTNIFSMFSAVQSTSSTSTIEASSLKSPSVVIVASGIKMSESLPSTPPLLTSADPSSSRSRSLNVDENSTTKAHQSPGHQLCRQNLDNKVLSFKSFNESYLEEGRPLSSMPSVYSKDIIAGGSHESEKYDPPCPIRTHGEKYFTNLYGKQDSKIKNKISFEEWVNKEKGILEKAVERIALYPPSTGDVINRADVSSLQEDPRAD